ncbi:hypothetical protein CRE_15470 [Caenorhabditis remanei]|uniref:F-box domain-containing protein n=1 Tax=Caenorhabditis remanei TaxID=31234 RepID=E3MSS6_CAERE|nr:hypothetical protein CRE_15470 [Caenorhabditis remanei]
MKISKFPWVVQKEILRRMNLIELVFMSFCSRKLREFVVNMIKWKSSQLETIFYHWHSPDYTRVASTYKGEEFSFLKIKVKPEIGDRIPIKMNFIEMDLQCCMPTESEDFLICCGEGEIETILQTIHNFFLSWIGSNIKYELTSYKYIPRVPNITSSQLWLLDKKTAASQLTSFLSYSPVPEFLCLIVISGYTNYEEIPGLAETLVLYCWTGGKADILLSNFKGRELYVYKAELNDSTVIKFLNDWKSSNGYRNLKYVNVIVDESFELHPDMIMSQCSLKTFDSMEKFPVYHYKQRYQIHPIMFHSFKFSSQYYIVRESDGYVASFKVQSNSMFFTAWNMNEKDFLEKHANNMFQ